MNNCIGLEYGPHGEIKLIIRAFAFHKNKTQKLFKSMRAYGRNIQVGVKNDTRCIRPWMVVNCETVFESTRNATGQFFDITVLSENCPVFDPVAW